MPNCEFNRTNPNTVTQSIERGMEERDTRAGLIINSQRMPKCRILEELGRNGLNVICRLVGFRTEQCPIARYYLGKIPASEASERLSSLGVFLSLETDSKIK